MKKEIKVKWFEYLVIHEEKVYEILDKWKAIIKNEGMLNRIDKLIELVKEKKEK